MFGIISAALVLATTSIKADGEPEDPPAGSSLEERVEQRSNEQSVQLEDREISRLEGRCSEVQSNIRQLQNQKISMLNNRDEVYERISGKTWLALGTIRLNNIDTFNLQQHATTLDEEIEEFRRYSSLYNQAIRDTLDMNCSADVEAFVAMIKTARLYDRSLLDTADNIRNIINNDVREELEALTEEV